MPDARTNLGTDTDAASEMFRSAILSPTCAEPPKSTTALSATVSADVTFVEPAASGPYAFTVPPVIVPAPEMRPTAAVPETDNVAFFATVTSFVSAGANASVPPSTATGPVNVLAADVRESVPVPSFLTPPSAPSPSRGSCVRANANVCEIVFVTFTTQPLVET